MIGKSVPVLEHVAPRRNDDDDDDGDDDFSRQLTLLVEHRRLDILLSATPRIDWMCKPLFCFSQGNEAYAPRL